MGSGCCVEIYANIMSIYLAAVQIFETKRVDFRAKIIGRGGSRFGRNWRGQFGPTFRRTLFLEKGALFSLTNNAV